MKRAIVTLAIGDSFATRWHRYCEAHWRGYCERHGYDLICIEQPLDDSDRAHTRSPAWQKCLILSQPFAAAYDQVVWVDADVLPSADAPSIADGVPVERVGAVDEYALPMHAERIEKLARYRAEPGVNATATEYYRRGGFPERHDAVVQTGVLVLSPAHHRHLLEDVYERYEDDGLDYEMRPLSYELLEAGVVTWLDPRFNTVWGHYKVLHYPFLLTHPGHARTAECAAEALDDVHFLHFAGSVDELPAAAEALRPRAERRATVRSSAARLQTPVVLLVHRRPDLTAQLVEIVRSVRPETVLVVGDGPETDPEVERTRAAIDFDCDVVTNYAADRLGMKRRVESGLDWAFETVGEAIVLEDDCHPDPSFFDFCAELLTRYKDEPRVTTISGTNFAQSPHVDASYFFSRYPMIWGWATWAESWRTNYARDLSEWPDLRGTSWLADLLGDTTAVQYWTHIFNRQHAQPETWDYCWLFGNWLAGGLAAVPTRNLVTNRGFDNRATNTRVDFRGLFSDLPTSRADTPLRHPTQVERDAQADAFLEDVMFSGNLDRLFQRIRVAH